MEVWCLKCTTESASNIPSQRYGLQGEHCINNLVVNNLEVFIIGDAGGIAALKLSDTEADLLIGGEVRLPGEVYFWQFCPVPSSWTWAVSSGGTELEVMELDHRSSTTKVAEHAALLNFSYFQSSNIWW